MFKVADEEGGGGGDDEDLECFLEDGKWKREKRKCIDFLDIKGRIFYRFQGRRFHRQLRWNNNYGLKVLLFRFLPVLLLFLLVFIIAVQYLSRPRQSLYGNDDLDDLSSPLVTIDNNNTSALYSKYLLYTPQCILKRVPTFDRETVNLFQPVPNKKYPCPPEDPISAGIKRVNYTSISVPQAGCQATEVERDPANEGFRLGKTVAFGERLLVDFPTAEAVKVYCGGQTKVLPLVPFRKPIWRNESSSSSPSSPSSLPSTSPPSPPTSQPNILAIGVDSISRLQFLRHFNSTREFITKHHFEGPLYGLHKVGDNTFPNLMAMFTGLDIEGVDELIPSPSRKLDALPLIFKQFSAKGYMTTYIEDMPNFGLWTYHEKNGFGKQQPLEYLMRPVNMLVYEELESDRKCYKGRLEMELYYDFVYDQLLAFRERRQPYLTFIHWGTLTHDEANNAGYADDPVRRLMERIFNANLQENTLILFYSDHGIRFGPISQTESGYHESRLPFMYWYIPEGLTLGDGLDAEQIRANLQLNSRRLASQFDVHATLLHILLGKPSPPLSADKSSLAHTFGHSLFTELPLNRTCEEAGIPEEYCLCRRFVPLTDAPSRHLLGEYILEHLNEQLAPYSANCTPLSLGRILETKVSESLSEASASTSFFSDSLLETVSVRLLMAPPSNATFDVTLRVNVNVQLVDSSGSLGAATIIEDQASIQRLSSLIRLDRYGDQSACVRDTPVESFCYCKDLL